MKQKIITIVVGILFFQFVSFENSYATVDKPKINSSHEDSTATAPKNWHHLDPSIDNVQGISSERAYNELLKGKESKTVVMAIIDSGVDVKHEDLQPNIWINEKEIPDNGIDDDKNGYIDDINGWNFIGGKSGENVNFDTFELTRLYVKYKNKFESKNSSNISKAEKEEYKLYLSVKKNFESKLKEKKEEAKGFNEFYSSYETAKLLIQKFLSKEDFTADDIAKIDTKDQAILVAKGLLSYTFSEKFDDETMIEYNEYYDTYLKYNLNEKFNPREIVGDDYSNPNEKYYGNNDVIGEDPLHGTHVAGIIGAVRHNNIGMDGIADNVKLMVVRTVPNGDERDKDVANAIYYAADNGADIINMSFGKAYSPEKTVVDDAFKYAESKGVLLIHAAGNDSENIGEVINYPNDIILNSKEKLNNWIEVGASAWKMGEDLTAPFSNYSKKHVDVFAPGVDIYSTVPDQKFKLLSGTSMACPVVAGVAALIMSYYPDLSAKQLKDILLKSSVKHKKSKVSLPIEHGEKEELIKFGKLSITGGIVNVYEALRIAEEMSTNKN